MTEAQSINQWRAFNRARAKYDKRMQAATQVALDAQFEPIITAFEQGRANPENLATTYPIQKLFEYIYTTVGPDFARMSYLGVKSGPTDFLTKAAGKEPEADLLEGFWKRTMKKIVDTQAGEKIKGITQTTKSWVKRAIAEVQEQGLSIPNAAKLLREQWKTISKSRAVVVSRTEILSSSNAGSLLGAKSTGLPLNKSWLATRDPRTRSKHIHADGQTVDLDVPFIVGGDELNYPGDSSMGAKMDNCIQCRCAITFKRKQ